MKYFYSSLAITVIGLIAAFFMGGLVAVYITALLAILEISLSFDNAVVNAKVLEKMDPVWQNRFIVFGIPIAVFGMRFLFPLLIVAIIGGISFGSAFTMAFNDPEQYHEILEAGKMQIFAFGGAFLLMVFLDFMFDEDRKIKWIHFVESSRVVFHLTKVNNIELIIAIGVGLYITMLTNSVAVAIAFFSGILLHSLIASLDELLSTDGVRSGIVGFLYLEVLDASFSFDGVLGAFALTTNVVIIMIGLGVGAMFVRSLTLYLVEHKTLQEFRFLEHGAHYAIAVLAIIMLVKIFTEVSEVFVGTVGIGLIIIAAYHSHLENKKAS